MEAICCKNKSLMSVDLEMAFASKSERDGKIEAAAMKSSPTKHMIQIKMKYSFKKWVTHTTNSSCQFMYKITRICMNFKENELFISC